MGQIFRFRLFDGIFKLDQADSRRSQFFLNMLAFMKRYTWTRRKPSFWYKLLSQTFVCRRNLNLEYYAHRIKDNAQTNTTRQIHELVCSSWRCCKHVHGSCMLCGWCGTYLLWLNGDKQLLYSQKSQYANRKMKRAIIRGVSAMVAHALKTYVIR